MEVGRRLAVGVFYSSSQQDFFQLARLSRTSDVMCKPAEH